MANHLKNYSDQAIAIIGISCEFAGTIHSPKDLWKVLDQSVDVSSDVPIERFDVESWAVPLSPQHENNEELIRRGYFIDNQVIEQFDPKFFGIIDKEAFVMDPCHRILLQKFVHLCEDAGYRIEDISHTRTGVFIGQAVHDHHVHCLRQPKESEPQHVGLEMGTYHASSRIAYHFDLHGPNMTIDAACSSSMAAVQLGMIALRNGEAAMVVVGGTQLNYAPETFFSVSQFKAISTDGRSRVFSVDANGFAKADGIGLLLLKRLADAVNDNDHIYCVLHDSIAAHDGSYDKPNYTVPSSHGQYRMLNEIYTRSNVDPKQVFYVECHGTGTKVGDPIEANTLGKFFSRKSNDPPLLIGSVKSNIGHTEGTAGIASLIKTALCMRYRCIPPNMNFLELNPNILANKYNLHVVTRRTYFPALGVMQPVVIGVSGYGVGGTSSHCIVMEWIQNHMLSNEQQHFQNGLQKDAIRQGVVLTFSAKSHASLRYQAKTALDWFTKENIESNYDYEFLVCLSKKLLFHRTTSFDYRVTFVSRTLDDFKDQLKNFSTNLDGTMTRSDIILSNISGTTKIIDQRLVAFIFSGQGPQWWSMGRQLYYTEPIFRQWIDRIDEKFRLVTKEWRLINELIKPTNEQESNINETNIAQPALFALQVALAAVWYSWKIYPSAIIGHSMGEVAAIFVARRITLTDAVNIIYHRARLQHRNTRQNGRMLAVSLSEAEVEEILSGIDGNRVSIAALNSKQSVTLSGDADLLEKIKTIINTLYPQVLCTWIRVENAFHSYQMERYNIREDLNEALKCLRKPSIDCQEDLFPLSPSIPNLFSTVTGGLVEQSYVFDAEYWWKNIRQPVQFHNSIKSMMNNQVVVNFYLEISPHPVLASSLTEILSSKNVNILASLKRKHDEQTTMLAALSQLELSIDDWKHWLDSRQYVTVIANETIKERLWSFPGYHFDNIPCWYETRESVITRRASRRICHPLLGARLWNQISATWVNEIDLKQPQFNYLFDHRVQGAILLAGACFIEIALAAGRELSNSTIKSIILENVYVSQALVLEENDPTEIHTIVTLTSHQFRIYSRPSKKDDCSRKGGMASHDVLGSYSDTKMLHNYASREWKLHANGTIIFSTTDASDISHANYLKDKILSNYIWDLKNEKCKRLYESFDLRGYNFGPTFQRILGMKGTKSLVMSEIKNKVDTHPYLVHPTLVDACLQSAFMLCPISYTFVPVSFGKITISLDKAPNWERDTIYSFASARPVLHGFTGDDEFSFDALLLSDNTQKQIISLEDIKIQKISEITHDSCSIYFDQLEKNAWLPGRTRPEALKDIDILLKQYLIKPLWLELPLQSQFKILPSPYQIFSKSLEGVELRSIIETSSDFDDAMVSEFMEDSSSLIRQFLTTTLARINKVNFGSTDIVYDEIRKLMNPISQYFVQALMEYQDTQDTSIISDFTVRFTLATLMQKYPLFQSIIQLLASCGSHLFQLLTGELDSLELMYGSKNQQSLYAFYNTITEANMKLPIKSLFDHITLSAKPEPARLLRILELGGGTGGTTIHIIEYILEFIKTNGTHVEYIFTDISPALFNSVKERLSKVMQGRNDQNLLRIDYDVVDLDQSPLQHRSLELESFDLVVAVNVIHVTKNVVHSIEHVRHFLVPGGLSVIIEITTPKPLLDFFFGLLRQWWVSSTDDPVRKVTERSVISVNRWREAFEIASGFDHLDFACNKWGLATIIAQKSVDVTILSILPERIKNIWVIICSSSHEKQLAVQISDHLKQVFSDLNIHIVLYKHDVKCVETTDNTIDVQSFFQHIFSNYNVANFIFTCGFNPSLSYDAKSHFLDVQEEVCVSLMQMFQCILEFGPANRPKLFILTSNAQNNAGINFNPIQAPIIGFVRSFQAEYQPQKIKLIDLQPLDMKHLSSSLIMSVINEMGAPTSSIFSDQEATLTETGDGRVIRSVLSYDSVLNEDNDIKESISKPSITIQPDTDCEKNPFRMELPSSHFLHDLKWVSTDYSYLNSIFDENQIIVRVHCIGLNFRDLLIIEDLYPTVHPFGSNRHELLSSKMTNDFSGTVIRVGSELMNLFCPGDRVCGTAIGDLAFSSHVVVNSCQISKVPADTNFTFEELASIPITFCTVLYALKERIALKHGQTCLIHSAAGGVGLAAIQYCQMMGVHVIATASSEEKREFLRKKYHLEHVFNSRDFSFVDEIRKVMPNGVDIIINSLAGPFLIASISLLASHGNFIELGRRDTHGSTAIELFNLRRDASFHVIDLLSLYAEQPIKCKQILQSVMDLIIEGKMHPIKEITIFEPIELITALGKLKEGSHIGKFILRLTESNKPLTLTSQCLRFDTSQLYNQSVDRLFSPTVCENGTILITGGLGVLGLSMTSWMIRERDVKSVVLVGRQTLDEIDRNSTRWGRWMELQHLARLYGAQVEIMKADVSDLHEVHQVIENISKMSKPLCGVIHAALVLHDCLVEKMTSDIFKKVVRARIRGAWNLHLATTSLKLNFFILLSSARNHHNDYGGANYNASNQFYDAFADWRHGVLKLPTLSISLPATSETQYFQNESNALTEFYRHQGVYTIPKTVAFELIEILYQKQLHTSLTTPIIYPSDWSILGNTKGYSTGRLRQIVQKKAVIMQATHNGTQTYFSTNKNIREETESMKSNIDVLTLQLKTSIAKLFGSDDIDRIDIHKPLIQQGMDSLMAVSLHNWLAKHMFIVIPMIKIVQGMSIIDILECINMRSNPQNFEKSDSHQDDTPSTTDKLKLEIESTSHMVSQMEEEALEKYQGINLTIPISTESMETITKKHPVLFCFTDMHTDEAKQVFSIFARHLKSFAELCLIPNTQSNLLEEYIVQVRRVQPCGPYYFLAHDASTAICLQIVDKLQQYQEATVKVLFLLYPSKLNTMTGYFSSKTACDTNIILVPREDSQSEQNLSTTFPDLQVKLLSLPTLTCMSIDADMREIAHHLEIVI